MKYLFWMTIVNIMVNISLKYAQKSSVFSGTFLGDDFLAYCGYFGFILSFYLYAKASENIDVSMLFPLVQGGTIAGTVLMEYVIFPTQISLISIFGIVSIIIGVFLLAPKKSTIQT